MGVPRYRSAGQKRLLGRTEHRSQASTQYLSHKVVSIYSQPEQDVKVVEVVVVY